MPSELRAPSSPAGEFHALEARSTPDGTWAFTAAKGRTSSAARYLLRFVRPWRSQRATEVADALLRVRHDSLLIYHATGWVESGVYSESMWLVRSLRKHSLSKWVNNNQMERGEILSFATQIFSGLRELHRRGLLHLDIRPGNILLSGSRWQLADFGVAELTGKTSLRPEDFAYRAPELVAGEHGSAAADVYSLAAIVAFLAAGSPPSGSLGDWLHEMPGSWREGLDSALSPDPSKRPSSRDVAVFLDNLAGAAPGLSIGDLDDLLSSSKFIQGVTKSVTRGLSRQVEATALDDAAQEVTLRLWVLAHDNPVFCRRFKDERAFHGYAVTSIKREIWRGQSLARRSVPADVETLDSIARMRPRSPATSSALALETLEDLEERLGSQSARICQMRMYGSSFDEIALVLSTESDPWSPADAFLTLVRLQRAYPELRAILPAVSPESAQPMFEEWLQGQVPQSTARLLSMRLAGYSHRQIADELELSVSSVSSRLFRLTRSDPSLGLLLDVTTLWPEEMSQARRILSMAERDAFEDLDAPWTSWLRLRAESAFRQAAQGKAPDRAAEAANHILGDLRLANAIRVRVLAEPSRTAMVPSEPEAHDLTSEIEAGNLVAFGSPEDAQVPLFQLETSGKVRSVVASINRVLDAKKDPYGVFYWWVEPNGRLGNRAPVELLDCHDEGDELMLLQLAQATTEPA